MPEENEVEKLRTENGILRQKISALEKEIAELKGHLDEEIKEIKKQIRTPDWLRQHNDRRQRGTGIEGKRKGNSRKTPDRVDKTKNVEICRCPECNGRLSDTVEIRDRYIEEIERLKSLVTKYRIHRKYCKKCKKIVEPKITDAFPNFRFGIFLCLYIVALNIGLSLPIRRIRELLRFTFAINISTGEIKNIIDKVAEEFGPEYEIMKKELKNMKSIYADETSWYINGKLTWLWVFLSEKVAIYHIQNSRGKKVPAKMLKGFKGILISDFYSAYTQGKISQKCLVHLLRDIFNWKKVRYFKSQELQKFALRLKGIILNAIDIEVKSRENRIKYEKKIQRLTSKSLKDGEVKRMCRRLNKHLNSLFTFLEYDVEFSNNPAERRLRPCVVARKISYGSRSKKGALHFATLKSINETCKLNDKDFLDYGKEYLIERITSES
ncbi:MAG: IS66 family transposase [archaeon]